MLWDPRDRDTITNSIVVGGILLRMGYLRCQWHNVWIGECNIPWMPPSCGNQATETFPPVFKRVIKIERIDGLNESNPDFEHKHTENKKKKSRQSPQMASTNNGWCVLAQPPSPLRPFSADPRDVLVCKHSPSVFQGTVDGTPKAVPGQIGCLTSWVSWETENFHHI